MGVSVGNPTVEVSVGDDVGVGICTVLVGVAVISPVGVVVAVAGSVGVLVNVGVVVAV